MPRLELFPFRYRDCVTGKWVKARYVAERREIAARHAEWEIIGPPEIRDVDSDVRYFTPWKMVTHAELMRMQKLPSELQPHLANPPAMDGLEGFLVALFLRRYVTYCARRNLHAQMQGAAHYFEVCRLLPFRALDQRFQRRGHINESCKSGRFGTPPLAICFAVTLDGNGAQ